MIGADREKGEADGTMGNTDRRGPDISDGWQGASDDDVDSGRPLKVAVIGAGVAGLGKTDQKSYGTAASAVATLRRQLLIDVLITWHLYVFLYGVVLSVHRLLLSSSTRGSLRSAGSLLKQSSEQAVVPGVYQGINYLLRWRNVWLGIAV